MVDASWGYKKRGLTVLSELIGGGAAARHDSEIAIALGVAGSLR